MSREERIGEMMKRNRPFGGIGEEHEAKWREHLAYTAVLWEDSALEAQRYLKQWKLVAVFTFVLAMASSAGLLVLLIGSAP